MRQDHSRDDRRRSRRRSESPDQIIRVMTEGGTAAGLNHPTRPTRNDRKRNHCRPDSRDHRRRQRPWSNLLVGIPRWPAFPAAMDRPVPHLPQPVTANDPGPSTSGSATNDKPAPGTAHPRQPGPNRGLRTSKTAPMRAAPSAALPETRPEQPPDSAARPQWPPGRKTHTERMPTPRY